MMSSKKVLTIVAVAMFGLSGTARAGVSTWDGGDFDWNSAHWGGGLPAPDDDMIIDAAGSIVTVAENFKTGGTGPAASVAVGETATAKLIVNRDKTLEVTGNVAVGPFGTLQVDGTLDADTGYVAGTLAGNGIIDVNSIDVSGSVSPGGVGTAGTLTIAAGSELAFEPDAIYNAEVNLGDGSDITADTIVVTKVSHYPHQGAIILYGTLAPKGVGRSDSDFFKSSVSLMVVDNTQGGILEGVGPWREFGAVDPVPGPGASAHIGQGAFLRDVSYPQAGYTTAVKLDVFVALGGDADGDKMVWQSDFDVLDANFSNTGSGMTWTEGNFDPWVDDKVWLSDWGLLRLHFADQDYTVPGAHADHRDPLPPGLPDDRMKLVVRLDLADENGAPVQLVGHDIPAMTTFQINSPDGHLVPAPDATSAPFEMFLGENTANDVVIASLQSEIVFGSGEQTFDLGFRVAPGADDLNGVWMNLAADQISYTVQYVPEPGTIVMLLGALAGLAVAVRRRRVA